MAVKMQKPNQRAPRAGLLLPTQQRSRCVKLNAGPSCFSSVGGEGKHPKITHLPSVSGYRFATSFLPSPFSQPDPARPRLSFLRLRSPLARPASPRPSTLVAGGRRPSRTSRRDPVAMQPAPARRRNDDGGSPPQISGRLGVASKAAPHQTHRRLSLPWTSHAGGFRPHAGRQDAPRCSLPFSTACLGPRWRCSLPVAVACSLPLAGGGKTAPKSSVEASSVALSR